MALTAERHVLALGTRASKLALAQSEIVRAALLGISPHLEIRLEPITTKGDTVQDRPLSEIGGNEVFVRQIEEALREGTIDLAVHSAKDLPSAIPPDTALAAFLPRADARDVLVSRNGQTLAELPPGARVGTSSPRRTCLLRAVRPDLTIEDIRGNVDTRLRKLREGQYDAIVLAAAGLERLGALDRVTEWLDPGVFIPAVGQGALAVQVRADDAFVLELVGRLDDQPTSTAVRAERAFLAGIGGNCSLPVAAHATLQGDSLTLHGMIGSTDGHLLRGQRTAPASAPEQAGIELASSLRSRGSGVGDRGPGTGPQADPIPGPRSPVPNEGLPLKGRRIVVTRAREQAGELVARLHALGARPVECPSIEIAPLLDFTELDAAISRLKEYDWVIFTSVNGVEAFASRIDALGMDVGSLCSRKLAAIGPATRAALGKLGCKPDFMPDSYVAEAILAQIGDVINRRVLLPRADIARKSLASGLRSKGAKVDEVSAYRTIAGQSAPSLAGLLRGGEVDAVTFASSSTVRYTMESLIGSGLAATEAADLLNRVAVVCIGPITAQTAREHGIQLAAVAEEYTIAGLVDALVRVFAPGQERSA